MGCGSLLLCAFSKTSTCKSISKWALSDRGLKNSSPEDVSDLIVSVSHGCQPSWTFRATQVLASCTSQPHVKDAGHPTDSISVKNASPASPKTRLRRHKVDNQGLGVPQLPRHNQPHQNLSRRVSHPSATLRKAAANTKLPLKPSAPPYFLPPLAAQELVLGHLLRAAN